MDSLRRLSSGTAAPDPTPAVATPAVAAAAVPDFSITTRGAAERCAGTAVKAEEDAQDWEAGPPVPAWRKGPNSGRFPTTLASSPVAPLAQSGFISALAGVWPWPAGSTDVVRRLFQFWNPHKPHKDEGASRRRQSALLELSALQHAALYAISGCDDVQFRLSSLNIAVRRGVRGVVGWAQGTQATNPRSRRR